MIKPLMIGAALLLFAATGTEAQPKRTAPAASTAMMGPSSGGCIVTTSDSLNFARLGVMRDTGIPSGGGGGDTGDGASSPTLAQSQQDRAQDQLQDQIDSAIQNTSPNTAVGDGPGKSTSSSGNKGSGKTNGVVRGPCPQR
jgi:hypothetical protein